MANKLTVELGVVDRMSNAFRKVEGSIQKFVNKAGNMFKQLVSIPNLIAGSLLVGIGKKFVDAASKIEVFQKQLEMVTGSAGKASSALGAIRDFARTSPLETEDVVQSYVRLRAVGIDPTMKQMRTLGGVAVLMNKSMGDMLNSFIGYNKRTLRSLGIEIDRTGPKAIIQSGNIKKVVEKDSASIRAALLEIWEQRFPNAIEIASDTFSSKMAIMRSEIFETVLVPLGEKVLPVIKSGLDDMTTSINGSASMFETLGDVILHVTRFVDLGLRGSFIALKTAILIPLEFMVVAVAQAQSKMASGFYSLIKNVNNIGVDMMMSQNAVIRTAGKGISDATMPMMGYFESFSKSAKENLQLSKNIFKEELSGIGADLKKAEDVWVKYQVAINKQSLPARGTLLEGTGNLGSGRKDGDGETDDDFTKKWQMAYSTIGGLMLEEENRFLSFNEKMAISIENIWVNFAESLEGRFKSAWDTITDLHSTAQEKISSLAEQGYRMMTDMLFEYIKSFVQAKLIQLAVGSMVSEKEQAGNYKTAASEGVSTAMSAGKSVAKIPYVGAILAIAAIAGVMALMATSISKAKSYAVGTLDHPGGLAKVHKDEYVNLPAHSRVYTRGESREIDAESSQPKQIIQNYTIMANSMAIVEELRRVIRSGEGNRLIADLKYAGA